MGKFFRLYFIYYNNKVFRLQACVRVADWRAREQISVTNENESRFAFALYSGLGGGGSRAELIVLKRN
jgi:hypothetical protein